MNRVKEWLGNMGSEFGQDIQLDEDGICNLSCEGNVMIIIEAREDSPIFYLSSPLLELPPDQEKMFELFAKALSLNLFMVETRGSTIGLAEDIGQLMLCFMQEKQGCDEDRFASILKGFYETVVDIRKNLSSFVDTDDHLTSSLPINPVGGYV